MKYRLLFNDVKKRDCGRPNTVRCHTTVGKLRLNLLIYTCTLFLWRGNIAYVRYGRSRFPDMVKLTRQARTADIPRATASEVFPVFKLLFLYSKSFSCIWTPFSVFEHLFLYINSSSCIRIFSLYMNSFTCIRAPFSVFKLFSCIWTHRSTIKKGSSCIYFT